MIDPIYRQIKAIILSTKACPDGPDGMACESCVAENIVRNLRAGHVRDVEVKA